MSRAARRYIQAREEIDPGTTPDPTDPELYECPRCPLPKGHSGDCLTRKDER